MNLFNAKYELDDRPIEEGCQLSGMQKLQQSVYPPSFEGKRDARNASVCAS